MAQRLWPRLCGCQVPPLCKTSAYCHADWPGRVGWEGGHRQLRTALSPFSRGLGYFHQHTYFTELRHPNGVSFHPHPIFPSKGWGEEREALFGLCGWVLSRETDKKLWEEEMGGRPEPDWQPLTLGKRIVGLQGRCEAPLEGSEKPSNPQL